LGRLLFLNGHWGLLSKLGLRIWQVFGPRKPLLSLGSFSLLVDSYFQENWLRFSNELWLRVFQLFPLVLVF